MIILYGSIPRERASNTATKSDPAYGYGTVYTRGDGYGVSSSYGVSATRGDGYGDGESGDGEGGGYSNNAGKSL